MRASIIRVDTATEHTSAHTRTHTHEYIQCCIAVRAVVYGLECFLSQWYCLYTLVTKSMAFILFIIHVFSYCTLRRGVLRRAVVDGSFITCEQPSLHFSFKCSVDGGVERSRHVFLNKKRDHGDDG